MSEQQPLIIRLGDSDDVVVALAELAAGSPLLSLGVTTQGPVPRGYKVA